ncbi:hypothetical protein [Turicibacter sanguinis]|uniref:hypothetical protein n=1 Tax=Turicibacter sanguinis TaxID=154288 RepID=UPI00232C545F|nr:hypothetical protein [Turicibacter sanguinis]MDB8575583.1 hypothetical protein [Turicibacter sanguinis]MDB8578781.1 hypothetical protein [Turicibacter sanguinis]MDB8584104.1 hypothetical protein [Turicibacter sanguinis]MDB8587983.1 hypothetical protein [Turicibacter sanguinis]MDB8598171.1 hypothetical protein [Turicibacter sanguinis]
MTEKGIRQELLLLENEDYCKQGERVFDFLNLFKKTNVVKWHINDDKLMVRKKGDLFMYQTLIFSVTDEHIIKNLYCLYRKAILLELSEQTRNEFDSLKGEQLSLF